MKDIIALVAEINGVSPAQAECEIKEALAAADKTPMGKALSELAGGNDETENIIAVLAGLTLERLKNQ